MDLAEAGVLARQLMDDHGLDDWVFVWDNAAKRAGQTKVWPGGHRQQISLSRKLMALWPEAEVRDTILHEIAHALVGIKHGHDPIWRAAAERIGARPDRTYSVESLPRVKLPWTGTCPNGHETTRQKRPTRLQSCGICSRTFTPGLVLSWAHNGSLVTPDEIGSRYANDARAAKCWDRLTAVALEARAQAMPQMRVAASAPTEPELHQFGDQDSLF